MIAVSILILELLFLGAAWSLFPSIREYFRHGSLSKKLEYQSQKQRSFISSLYLLFKTRTLFKRHQFIPNQALLNHKHGSTFQATSFGSTTTYTIEPHNVQAILASSFEHWGLAPTQLPAVEAFCGHGLLTTDGERWAKSRAIVTPFFRRAASIDLKRFDSILDEAFQRVPRKELVVDLQPIFFDMVSAPTEISNTPKSL